MAARRSVYISYRYSSCQQIAAELHRDLRDRGVDVFIDHDLPLGSDFTKELRRELSAREVLVVILANDTYMSVNGVLPEIRQAIDEGKRIIPLLLPGFDFRRDSHGTEVGLLEHIYGVRYNPRDPGATADAIIKTLRGTTRPLTTSPALDTPPSPQSPPSVAPKAEEAVRKPGLSDGVKIAIVTGLFALLAALAPPIIERAFPPPAPTATATATVTPTPTASATPTVEATSTP